MSQKYSAWVNLLESDDVRINPLSLTLFFFRGVSRNTSQRMTSVFLSVMTSRNICLLAFPVLSLESISCTFVRMGLTGRQTGSRLHSFITSALSEWIRVRVTPTHVSNTFNITRKEQKCGPGLYQALLGICMPQPVSGSLISVSHQHNEARLWKKEAEVTPRTTVGGHG